MLERQIEEIQAADKSEGHPLTIIRDLLDVLPESEKTMQRLVIEGKHLLAGGTSSGSQTLTMILYHLLSNPEKLRNIKVELAVAIPNDEDIPSCAKLETPLYLDA